MAVGKKPEQSIMAENAPCCAIIKEYMAKHDLTESDIARLLDVGHTTVGRWLRGEMKISRKNQYRIQAAFGHDEGPSLADRRVLQKVAAVLPSLSEAQREALMALLRSFEEDR